MSPIRVIVIDDSALMRKMITDLLESDNRIQVVANARNGEDGIQKVKELSPDVVTLDIEMPIMDGLTTLSILMVECPVPVVMLTSVTDNTTCKTVKAITSGAIDFIEKPSGAISLNIKNIKAEIISKVTAAAQVQFTNKPNTKHSFTPLLRKKNYSQSIIFIGSSTGGPRALQQVLQNLPRDFSSPILIVQHMPPSFTKSLAERLNKISNLYVKEAEHGELIKDKTVYIAPGNYHMKVISNRAGYNIVLTSEPEDSNYRPSVDVLLESAEPITGANKIVVILTGMGSDGAKGIRTLKKTDQNQEVTIVAESEETAIINGMPKAAINTNAVDYIVPLHQVGEMIHALTK